MASASASSYTPKTARPLTILIIGAGITGLGAAIALTKSGHKVVVLEQAEQIAEVGAGIQVAPNAARILDRWGVFGEVMKKANVLGGIEARRWKEGNKIGWGPLGDVVSGVLFSIFVASSQTE